MIHRNPRQRQAESQRLLARARLIRRTLYATAATLLVTALLMVAYLGTKRLATRPMRVVPGPAYSGAYIFRLEAALNASFDALGLDESSPQVDLARAQFRSLRPVLAGWGELHYVSPGGPGLTGEEWLFFAPFTLSGASLEPRLLNLLSESSVLQPRSGGPRDGAAGYFEVLNPGLLITSSPTTPLPEFRPDVPGGAEQVIGGGTSAVYTSRAGLLPPRLAESLPPGPFRDQLQTAPGSLREIRIAWLPSGQANGAWSARATAIAIDPSRREVSQTLPGLVPIFGISRAGATTATSATTGSGS